MSGGVLKHSISMANNENMQAYSICTKMKARCLFYMHVPFSIALFNIYCDYLLLYLSPTDVQ